MRTISYSIWLLLHVTFTYRVGGLTEHKVHNIVLYPDKHSWCKKTEIKQIVAYPGCSSIEIDNNVCVGACFSYSIPRTIPSAPGEVIIPYCDSCQPVDYEWKEVTLTCSDESEEDEGQTEMTKRVQVITNCSCTSCEKQYEEKKVPYYQKHTGSKSADDVPELMSLMMGVHHSTRPEGPESEEEEEAAEDVQIEQAVAPNRDMKNAMKSDEKENLIEEMDEDQHQKKFRSKLDKESRTLEILHLGDKHHSNSTQRINDLIEIAKSDHKHYEFGPHHSLIIKPDQPDQLQVSHKHRKKHQQAIDGVQGEERTQNGDQDAIDADADDDDGGGGEEDDQSHGSTVNQFKIHDNEEYLDQIAVESIQKEVHEKKVMSVPDMIYNASLKDDKWRPGVTMLEVPHHHLQPAVEGVELSYYGKSDAKEAKRQDEEE